MGSAPGLRTAFDSLHELAARETGLDDFGDPAYRDDLAFLLSCYDEQAILGDEGRERTRRTLIDCLASRLLSNRRLREHADCLDRNLERPIVIAGLPRTGSTALHQLIAADPAIQALEYFLGRRPDVRPRRARWSAHPSYRAALEELDRIYASSPELRAAHAMRAGEPDEFSARRTWLLYSHSRSRRADPARPPC